MTNSISSENILWNKGEMKTFSQTRTRRVAASKPVTKKMTKESSPSRNGDRRLRTPERKEDWNGEKRSKQIQQTSPLLMSLTYI